MQTLTHILGAIFCDPANYYCFLRERKNLWSDKRGELAIITQANLTINHFKQQRQKMEPVHFHFRTERVRERRR